MYFLTATPHKGDDEDYIARLRLLDLHVMSVDSAKHLVIRNLKNDVISIDGKECSHQERVKLLKFQFRK